MNCKKEQYHIHTKIGQTLTLAMEFYEDEAETIPWDLSIYDDIQMQVRKKAGSDPVLFASLDTGEFIISGAGDNILTLVLEIVGVDLLPGVYKYDYDFIKSGDPVVTPFDVSNFAICENDEITKQEG